MFSDYIDGGTRSLGDGRVELKCNPVVEENFYENRRHLDTAKELRGLGVKYMLLVGAYKGAQTAQDAAVRHLAKESNGFTVHELVAGSNLVPMEHPDIVRKAIRNFID